MPGSTADVENADSSAQGFGETFNRRNKTSDKLLVVDAPPDVVHATSEHRAVCRIRDASAGLEACDEVRQVCPEVADHWAERTEVLSGIAGKQRRVLFGQCVTL